MLTLLALFACTAPSDDTAEVEPPPPLFHDSCGGVEYDLLEPRGEVVDSQYLDTWDMPPALLGGIVELLELGGPFEVKNGIQMWQYRYTTQDRGEAIEATGLLVVPAHLDEERDEPWPVALMLHGFAGASDPCAPSDNGILGPALAGILASQGYVVIAPDFIGMNGMGAASVSDHAPLVGEQVAIGSWDAYRAGLDLLADRTPTAGVRDDVVIWGASQGGHAAFFVDLVAPYYAPEADVVAVVASTPATDLTTIAQDAVTEYSVRSPLTALTMVGMRRWYGIPATLDGVLTNEEPYFIADTVEQLLALETDDCEVEVETEVELSSVDEIYTDPYLSAAQAWDTDNMGPWPCFFERNSVSGSGIERLSETPVLTVYGRLDTLVKPETQYESYDQLCDEGWNLEFMECADAPHGEATLWSLNEQMDWMAARLAGEPITATTCERAEPVCCSGSPSEVCE